MTPRLVTFRATTYAPSTDDGFGHVGITGTRYYLHVIPGDLADLRATLRRRVRLSGLTRLVLECEPATARAYDWWTETRLYGESTIPQVHRLAELRIVPSLDVPARSRVMAELARGQKLGTEKAREMGRKRHAK